MIEGLYQPHKTYSVNKAPSLGNAHNYVTCETCEMVRIAMLQVSLQIQGIGVRFATDTQKRSLRFALDRNYAKAGMNARTYDRILAVIAPNWAAHLQREYTSRPSRLLANRFLHFFRRPGKKGGAPTSYGITHEHPASAQHLERTRTLWPLVYQQLVKGKVLRECL